MKAEQTKKDPADDGPEVGLIKFFKHFPEGLPERNNFKSVEEAVTYAALRWDLMSENDE